MRVNRRSTAQGALALGALGVVFGDIGTSPLYTVQTVFSPADPHPVKVTEDSIFGVISLIFWAVTIVVTITYITLVMRADNDGEGGIMSLIALIRRRALPGGRRAKVVLAALGIFGASLFFGDSMITPAISVLSAIEGVKVAAPSVSGLVIPITVAIIIALFLVQRLGTGAVGRLFGPVMGVWFTVLGVLGVRGIADHPEILKALSPTYAVGFLVGHFETAFFSLTAVVLAVTGAEALYADMGHFGRSPIRRAWLLVVFPACILNYMGQGALILGNEGNTSSPFFLLAPGWARLPMVFLAAVATVIASQAVITGAYSVAQQAARLGYLPRLRIKYTSEEVVGQIYIPFINWLLLVAVLTLVLTFRSSAALAYAYGTAVTGTITITTLLFFYYARHQWRWPLWIVLTGGGFLLAIDLLFFASNLTKLLHGAWLPLLIGIITFTILTTWQRGRELVTEQRIHDEGPLPAFIEQLHAMKPPLPRVPGTAVFLNRGKDTAPLAHASERRTQPRPAQARPHPDGRDQDRTARPGGRADHGRRPRLQRRPDHPRHGPLRLHGPAEHSGPASAYPRGRDRTTPRPRRAVVLPVAHRDNPGPYAGHEPVAQAAVHSDVTDHRRRRRGFPAPP